MENDPRIYGVSSSKDNNITTVKKGIFTIVRLEMVVAHGQLNLRKLNMIKIRGK